VASPLGEAVGVNFVSAADKPALARRLEECDPQDYFERGIELAIAQDGLKVMPLDISEFPCIEVDFREDLEQARRRFG
jgi:CDP-glycerol glycerophosphotransferase